MSLFDMALVFALSLSALLPVLQANFLGYGCTTLSGPGCRTCVLAKYRTSFTHCDSCNDGYYLSGTTCDAYNCTTGNGLGCKTCIAQVWRMSHADCSSCNDGYHLFGTSCVAYHCTTSNGLGCKTCVTQERRTSNADCDSCSDGYFLSGTSCRAYACDISHGSGCKSCLPQEQRNSSTDCRSCNGGYYLSGTTCRPIPAQGQVFQGYYGCSQGVTGLQIHFDAWPSARFKFYPLSSSTHNCSGEFNMSGSLKDSRFIFKPGSWISNPCGYSSVGLSGVLRNNGEDFSGEVSGCSSFNASLHGIQMQESQSARDDNDGNRSSVEVPCTGTGCRREL